MPTYGTTKHVLYHCPRLSLIGGCGAYCRVGKGPQKTSCHSSCLMCFTCEVQTGHSGMAYPLYSYTCPPPRLLGMHVDVLILGMQHSVISKHSKDIISHSKDNIYRLVNVTSMSFASEDVLAMSLWSGLLSNQGAWGHIGCTSVNILDVM